MLVLQYFISLKVLYNCFVPQFYGCRSPPRPQPQGTRLSLVGIIVEACLVFSNPVSQVCSVVNFFHVFCNMMSSTTFDPPLYCGYGCCCLPLPLSLLHIFSPLSHYICNLKGEKNHQFLLLFKLDYYPIANLTNAIFNFPLRVALFLL